MAIRISEGDKIKVWCQGELVEGKVISAMDYDEDGGWYIEMTDLKGVYRYWRQGQDGGELLEVNDKRVEELSDRIVSITREEN